MAKGIELPVNVLVIIVIGVLVLIALATMVASGILSLKPISIMMEKNSACAQFTCGSGNQNPSINVDLGTFDKNLVGLCKYDGRCTTGDLTELKKYCGCPL